MVDSPTNPSPGGLRAHACVLCQRRKVKCDRRDPCSGCIKANVECEYRDPLPPRRRKRKTPESAMVDRFKRYETALLNAGIDVASLDEDDFQDLVVIRRAKNDVNDINARPRDPPTTPGHTASESTSRHGSGRLITKKGKSIYLDKLAYSFLSRVSKIFSLQMPIVICGRALATR